MEESAICTNITSLVFLWTFQAFYNRYCKHLSRPFKLLEDGYLKMSLTHTYVSGRNKEQPGDFSERILTENNMIDHNKKYFCDKLLRDS